MLGRLIKDLVHGRREESAPDASTVRLENPLADYFVNNPGRLIDKWHHYFDIYQRHFYRHRGRSPVVVEIGVFHGGSLQMWHHYFGPGARIVGVDTDPRCRQFEDENTTILIGDQADRDFLADIRRRFPRVDIVIDDGGHTMKQQITTFEELYPHIHPEGVYLCEDVHTSFLPAYGGGFRREGTFLEFSKTLVDRLYGWYSTEGSYSGAPADSTVSRESTAALFPKADEFTRSADGLHFYDSIVVVEKYPRTAPTSSRSGTPSF